MNIEKARTILNEAARLMELTATFQARYGRGYVLRAGTPQEAWSLYDDIMDAQSIIANLLDPDALGDAHYPYGKWWEHHDVMEPSMVHQLIQEVSHLLGSLAHIESHKNRQYGTPDNAVCMTQRAIAGMLHPESYRIVSDPPADARRVG